MTKPRVEIFIVNRNGETHLEETLSSVVAQDWGDRRIIFSDNGSTDQSLAIAAKFEKRGELEIRARRPGTPDHFSHCNLCLSECESPYVAFWHADDLYASDILSRQLAYFDQDPACGAVVTGGQMIDAQGNELWAVPVPRGLSSGRLEPQASLEVLMTHGNSFLLYPSALYRAQALREIGGFPTGIVASGDVELWMRLMWKGAGLAYLGHPLIRYRISTGQGSDQYERDRISESDFFEVLDRVIAQVPVSDEARRTYESLKNVDRVHTRLNQLRLSSNASRAQDWEGLRLALASWSTREGQLELRKLGGVDRWKIRAASQLRRLPGLALKQLGAGWISRMSDPRSSLLLRWGLWAWRRGK